MSAALVAQSAFGFFALHALAWAIVALAVALLVLRLA